jgi:hypothetical protein
MFIWFGHDDTAGACAISLLGHSMTGDGLEGEKFVISVRQSSPESETCLVGISALNLSSMVGTYFPRVAALLHCAR